MHLAQSRWKQSIGHSSCSMQAQKPIPRATIAKIHSRVALRPGPFRNGRCLRNSAYCHEKPAGRWSRNTSACSSQEIIRSRVKRCLIEVGSLRLSFLPSWLRPACFLELVWRLPLLQPADHRRPRLQVQQLHLPQHLRPLSHQQVPRLEQWPPPQPQQLRLPPPLPPERFQAGFSSLSENRQIRASFGPVR